MYMQMKNIIALLFLLSFSVISSAADIWYEDNNLGVPKGVPADFLEKFRKPETFKQATGYIDVYMVRSNVLDNLSDKELTDMFYAYLKKNNIKLAVDVVGATWAQAKGRNKWRSMEMSLFQRLKRLGVNVEYISLQSVLSKPLMQRKRVVEYSINKRLDDVVAYAKDVHAIYLQAQIGIIDALPAHGKDYRGPYRELKDALAEAGMALSFIHLDMPFEHASEHRNNASWQSVREVENYVENDLGVRFGLFVSSNVGGQTSSQAFHQRVIATMECYAGVGGTPSDFIIASWYPNPKKTIPETATGNDYPAMRTVLEFGRELERVEKSDASKLSAQKLEGGLMCNAAKKSRTPSGKGNRRRLH